MQMNWKTMTLIGNHTHQTLYEGSLTGQSKARCGESLGLQGLSLPHVVFYKSEVKPLNLKRGTFRLSPLCVFLYQIL